MEIDCRKCEYYRVTWDKNAPHGCRVFGFKGKKLPGATVCEASSGRRCQFYRNKRNGMGGRRLVQARG